MLSIWTALLSVSLKAAEKYQRETQPKTSSLLRRHHLHLLGQVLRFASAGMSDRLRTVTLNFALKITRGTFSAGERRTGRANQYASAVSTPCMGSLIISAVRDVLG